MAGARWQRDYCARTRYIVEPVYDREELIVADLNLSEIVQEFLTLDVPAGTTTPGPTCSHSKRKRNKFSETQLFGTNEPVATGRSGTYSGGLNLIHMGRNIFLLVLALACMIAAGRAQTKPNHLSGQTSPYLKRAVSQPVDWYPWDQSRSSAPAS